MAERFTKISPFLKCDTVAPPVEEDADLKEYKAGIKPDDEAIPAERRKSVREGLQDAIDRLQEVADQLNRMEQPGEQ